MSRLTRRGNEAEQTSHYPAAGGDGGEPSGLARDTRDSTSILTKSTDGAAVSFWVKTGLVGVLVVLLTATGLVASRKPADAATLALPGTPAMALSSSLLVPLEPARPTNLGATGSEPTPSPLADPAKPAQHAADAAPEPPASPPSVGILPDGRVVLNAASEEDLRKLPRVGPSRARSILALRAKLGKFRSVNDLLRVKGIGRKTLERMKPKLVVDAPAVAPEADKPSAARAP